jgi:transcriptional regulator with XRE-family HTH domain
VDRFGAQQSEITIVYRFSRPEEPAALVLPRSHRINNRNRVPEKLETVGDHLLRRRVILKLLQKQVAEQLGVDKMTISNWENGRSEPGPAHMPAVIRFLGYNPLPTPKGWPDRLVQTRTAMGLTQREAARRIGVDAGTLARWERGEREPAGAFAKLASRFLAPTRARESQKVARTA